jgi:hypothetical protein
MEQPSAGRSSPNAVQEPTQLDCDHGHRCLGDGAGAPLRHHGTQLGREKLGLTGQVHRARQDPDLRLE